MHGVRPATPARPLQQPVRHAIALCLPGWSTHLVPSISQDLGKIIVTVDGKSQRNALTAAERAVRSLGSGDAERAAKNAQKAAALDQVGLFGGLPDAVDHAANQLETAGSIDGPAWDQLSEAVGPGPLAFLIDEVRDG